jgi:hypothetical protein
VGQYRQTDSNGIRMGYSARFKSFDNVMIIMSILVASRDRMSEHSIQEHMPP